MSSVLAGAAQGQPMPKTYHCLPAGVDELLTGRRHRSQAPDPW
jgi:hypothetical protein